MAKLAILGAGSWGTALAMSLRARHEVFLWVRRSEALEALRNRGENEAYLPGRNLHGIHLTGDAAEACSGAELVFLAMPSRYLKAETERLRGVAPSSAVPVSLVKGFEKGSFRTMSRVIHAAWPESPMPVVLSGPSHAEEVADGLPTALVAASISADHARLVRELVRGDSLRVYGNADPLGVEIGGSVKNIIALAAGMCRGLGFGDNTQAALLTRGMAEIARLGEHLGAKPKTFYGLAGMGDLIGTCMSPHSRNRRVGERLAKGETWSRIESGMKMVAEGVDAARAVHEYAEAHGLKLPITRAVYGILFRGESPEKNVVELMTRDPRDE